MSSASHPDLEPTGGGRDGRAALMDKIEGKAARVERIPRWRIVATARARRLAEGGWAVRCLNDLGHAVDVVFSEEDWAWARGVR